MSAGREAPVVVVGSPADEHASAVARAVEERGARVRWLDATRFPGELAIALGEGPEAISVQGQPLGRPRAVYLRSLYLSPLAFGVDAAAEMDADWRRTLVVYREKAEFLVSVVRRWEELGVPLYNPLSASDALRKPYQIGRLAAAGIPVPETLWTNDPEAVRRFARGRRVVYKPLAGGAATRELDLDGPDGERLERLANSPVTFQELLPGTDLRVYVLDGRVISAYRIESSAIDFRGNEQTIHAFEPDGPMAELCLRATRALGLRFTGMDLKAAVDGEPRVLELNGSPMFLGFDQRAGTDVLGALADALVGAAVPA